MRKKSIYFLALALTTLFSCFPDDTFEPLIPFEGVVGTTTNSIYTHQSFFSLRDSNEVSYNAINAWDIGFDASENGEHVILNSGDLLYITNLGSVDFTSTISVPDTSRWIYDASTGNPDSLAIKNWVNTDTQPYEYSNKVYVLAKKHFDEELAKDVYTPLKKFKIIELTNTHYKLVSDILENSTHDTTIIEKDDRYNYIKISLQNTVSIVNIEPENTKWDIQFTQYNSIIPDDYGVLTPYLLRGAYINFNKIKVARCYISIAEVPNNNYNVEDELKAYFESDSIKVLHDSLYSSNWDAIGYKWKDVTIDEDANTAVYKADTRCIYLIKDIESGVNYKLRFFSYYSNGVKGYPWFQYGEIR